jgi:hypothetical protein
VHHDKKDDMVISSLQRGALGAAALAMIAGNALAKDCFSSDPNVRLATGYCDVPTDGSRVDGKAQSTDDPFYALDCEDVSGGNPGTPVEGFNRFFVLEANLDCNGPIIGTEAGQDLFDVPERLTLLAEQELDVFLDRSDVLNVNGTGPIKVGVLTDAVYRDSTDNQLVFSMHVKLEDELPQNPGDGPCPGGPGCVENEAEVNFFLRSGSEGFTVQAASAERRNGGLRLYNAARTVAKILNGATPFDPDWVRFQSDLNVSELNPTSRFFFMKSDAACYEVGIASIEVNQAGEEGQPQVSAFLNGFVPQSCEAVPTTSWWGLATFAALLVTMGAGIRRRWAA